MQHTLQSSTFRPGDRTIRDWIIARLATDQAESAAVEAERQAFVDSYEPPDPDARDTPEPGTNEWYYERGYDPEPDWSADPAVDWRHGLLYYKDGLVTSYDGTVIHEAVAEDRSATSVGGRPAIEPGEDSSGPVPADVMRGRWEAENAPDPGPTERQLTDWASTTRTLTAWTLKPDVDHLSLGDADQAVGRVCGPELRGLGLPDVRTASRFGRGNDTAQRLILVTSP